MTAPSQPEAVATSDHPPVLPAKAESGGAGERPKPSLGPLTMIWRAALAYPGRVVLALGALLVTAAATLAIPAGFRLIIDRGFARGGDPADIARWFEYLL